MLAYGGDAYSGYVPSYDGDVAWAQGDSWSDWGAQAWTSPGYDQVSYDGRSWGLSQQGWGGAGALVTGTAPGGTSGGAASEAAPSSPGPKFGAELLTELRLAELKRLIDRDARALQEVATSAERGGPEVDQCQSAEGTTCAPESNEDTPVKQPLGDDLAAGAAARRELDHADRSSGGSGEGFVASGDEIAHVHKSGGSGPALPKDGGGSSDAARPAPPGLEKQAERGYIALADFLPPSRDYGELPVWAGEEIFVGGEVHDGWIFGVRHGVEPDEGWLPASALGIGAGAEDLEDAGDAGASGSQPWRKQEQPLQQRSTGSGRRGRGRAGGSDAMVTAAWGADANGAAAGGRKQGSGASTKAGATEAAAQQKQREAEEWHHHGNWWSKQRHLRPEKEAAAPAEPAEQGRTLPRKGGKGARRADGGSSEEDRPRASQAPQPREQERAGRWGGLQRERDRATPAPAEGAVAATSKGNGGGWAGGAAGPKGSGRGRAAPDRQQRERMPRERPALTSLLDRLNKPMLPPVPTKVI